MDESFPAGIDEAGRGCLIGPMFMVCAIIKNHSVFSKLDLADSKKYGSSVKGKKMRAELYLKISSCCSIYSTEISADVVDHEIINGSGLNELERKSAAFLLKSFSMFTPCIADGVNIFKSLTTEFHNLAVENKADTKYRAVMAASICAKHLRDQWVENYFANNESIVGYKPSGGGYVNKSTLAFIEDFRNKTGSEPLHVRKSWKLK